MASRRAAPITAITAAPAITRCSCSTSSATWNAALCGPATSTPPRAGVRCCGERLFQTVEKAVRIKGRLRIGPSQQLVQDGIRNRRLFASRHGWAPFHPSCPPTHEIPDSLDSFFRGFSPDQQGHEQPEIVPGDMDQIALVDIL